MLIPQLIMSVRSQFPDNTDESQVPLYTLPDPLHGDNGIAATDHEDFSRRVRPELLEKFRRHVYGRTPTEPVEIQPRITLNDVPVEENHGRMREIELTFSRGERSHRASVLLFLPRHCTRPVPAFLGLNFVGNHAVCPDPRIAIHRSWIRNDPVLGISDHRAPDSTRGAKAHRWPVREILQRGYALATLYYGDIDPDFDDGFTNGVHALYPETAGDNRQSDDWGSIGAWAWSLSRVLDYLETVPEVDAGRTAVIGHSRLGKTALWAGAQDTRFALVISNASGCGGAALSRRAYGERLIHINTNFPHWFCSRFREYNEREDQLPVDQHQLFACIAPRPVCVGSAVEDTWCDPRGELLALWHANPVYRLRGIEGLPAGELPAPGGEIGGYNHYHLRAGDHDLLAEDWSHYLAAADRHLRNGKG